MSEGRDLEHYLTDSTQPFSYFDPEHDKDWMKFINNEGCPDSVTPLLDHGNPSDELLPPAEEPHVYDDAVAQHSEPRAHTPQIWNQKQLDHQYQADARRTGYQFENLPQFFDLNAPGEIDWEEQEHLSCPIANGIVWTEPDNDDCLNRDASIIYSGDSATFLPDMDMVISETVAPTDLIRYDHSIQESMELVSADVIKPQSFEGTSILDNRMVSCRHSTQLKHGLVHTHSTTALQNALDESFDFDKIVSDEPVPTPRHQIQEPTSSTHVLQNSNHAHSHFEKHGVGCEGVSLMGNGSQATVTIEQSKCPPSPTPIPEEIKKDLTKVVDKKGVPLEFLGVMPSNGSNIPPKEKRKRVYTKAERENRKRLKETPACFRCKMKKIPCESEFPCDGCKIWMEATGKLTSFMRVCVPCDALDGGQIFQVDTSDSYLYGVLQEAIDNNIFATPNALEEFFSEAAERGRLFHPLNLDDIHHRVGGIGSLHSLIQSQTLLRFMDSNFPKVLSFLKTLFKLLAARTLNRFDQHDDDLNVLYNLMTLVQVLKQDEYYRMLPPALCAELISKLEARLLVIFEKLWKARKSTNEIKAVLLELANHNESVSTIVPSGLIVKTGVVAPKSCHSFDGFYQNTDFHARCKYDQKIPQHTAGPNIVCFCKNLTDCVPSSLLTLLGQSTDALYELLHYDANEQAPPPKDSKAFLTTKVQEIYKELTGSIAKPFEHQGQLFAFFVLIRHIIAYVLRCGDDFLATLPETLATMLIRVIQKHMPTQPQYCSDALSLMALAREETVGQCMIRACFDIRKLQTFLFRWIVYGSISIYMEPKGGFDDLEQKLVAALFDMAESIVIKWISKETEMETMITR